MRATQPVCSIRVSRRLAKRSDARQEIVFPQKKYFLQLRNNRSTRIPEFQTNQADARNLCAASHDTTRSRYLYFSKLYFRGDDDVEFQSSMSPSHWRLICGLLATSLAACGLRCRRFVKTQSG